MRMRTAHGHGHVHVHGCMGMRMNMYMHTDLLRMGMHASMSMRMSMSPGLCSPPFEKAPTRAPQVRLLNLSSSDQLVSFDSWRFTASLAILRSAEQATHCASLNGCAAAPVLVIDVGSPRKRGR